MKKNEHGGRIYDKSNACLYCENEYLKIARHLRNVHKSESEVMQVLAIDDKSNNGKHRQKLEFDRLRLKGNFYHNMKVLQYGGDLKVCRRPAEDEIIDPKTFKPCPHCLGFVQKHELWRHVANCPFNERKKKGDTEANNRKLQYESQLLLFGSQDSSNHDAISLGLREHVISSMRVDEISMTAKTDELILTFGKSLFEKSGSGKANYISQKMRSLARLLMELRKLSPGKGYSLADFISPTEFDLVVTATKNLCSHNVEADNDHLSAFDRPSLALHTGYYLKSCASLLRGAALRKRDQNLKDDVESFLELLNSEWSSKISSAALRTLSDAQFKKTPILPVTADLVKLREYLLSEIPNLTSALKSHPTLENWRTLAELTASRIIVFNKRRGNEGTKLEIAQFKDRPTWAEVSMEEMSRSLKPLELELCKRYVNHILFDRVSQKTCASFEWLLWSGHESNFIAFLLFQ